MPVTVSSAVLPARSSQVPVADWSAPSSDTVWVTALWSRSDTLSVQSHVTVTSELFQPAPFASGLWSWNVMSGGVLSMLMPLTVAVFVLSALSVAVPLTDWFVPSLESVVEFEAGEVPSATQLARPEAPVPVSEHRNVTVTSVLFQPYAFAEGLADPEIDGFAESRFTVVLADAELPALS